MRDADRQRQQRGPPPEQAREEAATGRLRGSRGFFCRHQPACQLGHETAGWRLCRPTNTKDNTHDRDGHTETFSFLETRFALFVLDLTEMPPHISTICCGVALRLALASFASSTGTSSIGTGSGGCSTGGRAVGSGGGGGGGRVTSWGTGGVGGRGADEGRSGSWFGAGAEPAGVVCWDWREAGERKDDSRNCTTWDAAHTRLAASASALQDGGGHRRCSG